MKKSPANKKTKKKVVTTSNNAAEKKRSVKVYRKDGTLKSETTSRRGNAGFDKKGVYKGSTKKETRYTGSPRTLKTKAVEVDVKDASTRSYTKYKKDGTVKKQLKSTNIPGQSGDSKKIARKGRIDAKGAQTVSAKAVDVKRSPAKMKKPVKKTKTTTASGSKVKAKLKKGTIKVKSKPSREAKKEGAKGRKFVMNTEGGSITLSDPNKYKSRRAAKKSLEVAAKESMAKMKSPAKKPLVGKQKSLPKELQQAILKSPGKMLSKSAIKMMDKSPMNMKTPMKKSKQKVEQDYARNAIADYKSGKTKEAKYEKKKALEVAAGESPAKMDRKNLKKAKKVAKQAGKAAQAKSLLSSSNKLRDFSADNKGAKKLEKKSMKKHDAAKKLRQSGYKSSAMMKDPKMKKKTTYSSSKIDPSYHDQASKTVSTQKGRYSEGKTKTKFVNSDSPYHDKNYMNRESLTKTKTVNKGYGQSGRSTTNETRKSISPKRADRMRSRFRKGLEKQSPSMMKTNQDGGGYAAKNPAAPARQLKKLGSILSKHMKSN